MKVLVTGATGKQGGALIQHLLKEGKGTHQVRALTRSLDSASSKKLSEQGVEVVQGSLTDKESLAKVVEGRDAAFLVTSPMNKGGADEEVIQGKNFIDAVKASGSIKHLVFSSVGSADQKTGIPHFDSKFLVEEYLRSSGVPYTIIRPVAFYDNFPKANGFASFMTLGFFEAALCGKKIQLISCADIALVAYTALANPDKYKGQAIDLAAEDLTMTEVQEAYNKANGVYPWKAYLPSFVVNLLPYDMKTMAKWFYTTGYRADVNARKAEFPGLMSFEAWLKSNK